MCARVVYLTGTTFTGFGWMVRIIVIVRAEWGAVTISEVYAMRRCRTAAAPLGVQEPRASLLLFNNNNGAFISAERTRVRVRSLL